MSIGASAQLSLDDFKKQMNEDFQAFKDTLRSQQDEFWQKINKEYAEFLASPWKPVEIVAPKPIPPKPKPVVIDDDNVTIIDDKIIKIDTVYVPLPKPIPQPKPVVPIWRDKKPAPLTTYMFSYFGTPGKVTDIGIESLRSRVAGKQAGEIWEELYNMNADLLVNDVLRIRDENGLCDWAFRGMVESLSRQMLGNTQASVILNGYIMTHAGYDVRFLANAAGQMFLGYSSDMAIFNSPAARSNRTYYVADARIKDNDVGITMCDFPMPGERPLSMRIDKVQNFSTTPSDERVVKIKYHNAAGDTVRASVNKNLVDFYDTYPKVWGNQSSWQIVAGIPTDPYLTKQLYPQLKKLIKDMNQQDAVNTLMGVCQSFPYGYDDEIWGYDYPLTVEQTWYHPQSDCEDHAIHLSRLVRDLLGLKTALIYLPGHLVTGIVFTDSKPEGSKVMHNGLEYLICDPTYFGTTIGKTFVSTDPETTVIYILDD